MFIDLGSETPHISDDEIGEAIGKAFSRENLFDIQDSDGENVEFIISSCESSDDENSQQRLPVPRTSNSQNPISFNAYPSRSIDRVGRDYPLGTLYESETDSAKMKSDTDQDNISHPSCSTESSPPRPRIRKFSSAEHPDVILQDTVKRKRLPPCRFNACIKDPKRRYFVTLFAYIAFLCLGSLIFIVIEKPNISQSGLPNTEIIESLYDCHCLSSEKLAEILTELSNAPPSKLRKYITHITNKRKLSSFTSQNETHQVDTKDDESSWSFGTALFFCVNIHG
nr:hypothetical transcript [Hymenolepis microstoma]